MTRGCFEQLHRGSSSTHRNTKHTKWLTGERIIEDAAATGRRQPPRGNQCQSRVFRRLSASGWLGEEHKGVAELLVESAKSAELGKQQQAASAKVTMMAGSERERERRTAIVGCDGSQDAR